MIYTMQITAEAREDYTSALHNPVKVVTVTQSSALVDEAEIDMVEAAFKAQVRQLLNEMINR